MSLTNAELAKKIREAIFDQAEQDGRVMHGDSVDAVIERVLAAERPAASSPYGFYLAAPGQCHTVKLEPGALNWVDVI